MSNGDPRQSQDGTAHFAYYDPNENLSFVWDGESNNIEVSEGGYGEPVSDEIAVPLSLLQPRSALDTLRAFRDVCEDWMAARAIETISDGAAHQMIGRIFEVMNRREWNADTTEQIGRIFFVNGIKFRGPED